jgi:hypothetical protein
LSNLCQSLLSWWEKGSASLETGVLKAHSHYLTTNKAFHQLHYLSFVLTLLIRNRKSVSVFRCVKIIMCDIDSSNFFPAKSSIVKKFYTQTSNFFTLYFQNNSLSFLSKNGTQTLWLFFSLFMWLSSINHLTCCVPFLLF